jgi:hypothetical protein
MTMTLEHAVTAPTNRWTPARYYLLVVAISHLTLGIGGLVVDRSFPIGAEATRVGDSGHIFGVLVTNGWHSLAALSLGLLAAWVVYRPGSARRVALALGVFHVGLVVQLALWDPSNFWIASNGADQIVHASTAAGGIVSGLLTRPS